MNDYSFSLYIFSIVKDDEQFQLIEKIDSEPPLPESDRYFIKISSTKEGSYSGGLESEQPKIFVIKSEDDFSYVGYANESMYSRITKDLADTLSGFYLREGEFETKELGLYVFEFIPFADLSKTETRKYYQAIQSELIFLIKAQTGLWPILQKQVSISNANREEVIVLASEMFEKII